MSQNKSDSLVFIGRFQPFHVGHLEVMLSALEQASTLIVLVGSSNQPRTEKNPFTFEERKEMILNSLHEVDPAFINRVSVQPLRDQKYNDQKWAIDVQEIVDRTTRELFPATQIALRVGVIGHTKDESSYYLKMFPQWGLIEHQLNEMINATDLRGLIFEGKSLKFLDGVVPKAVLTMLANFVTTDEYKLVRDEYNMIKKYKKAWEAAPYAPTFVTTDAVVIQSGHILLIERGAAPGKGLFALVGGFLEQDEWLEDGMIRELREETRLKVPTPVLKGNIKTVKVYDRPDRSARGRTITHAYLIELPPGPLPAVKGSDDAAKAFWIPLSEVREDQMFEDHYHVIQDLIS